MNKERKHRQLVLNQIKTPDGTILTSNHRHDFVSYTDHKTGKTYAVDGGLDYARRVYDNFDYEEQSVYLDDPYEMVREAFTWGSYGKNGDQPKHYIKLCDLTEEHINAILETQTHISDWVRELMEKELNYRKQLNKKS
jgi:hypothetical protein